MEKEENDRTFSDYLLIICDPFLVFMIGFLLLVTFFSARSMYQENDRRATEYETYGCYRVEKEYQECGPVEGKPGFTRCEMKKKLVCPEVAN